MNDSNLFFKSIRIKNSVISKRKMDFLPLALRSHLPSTSLAQKTTAAMVTVINKNDADNTVVSTAKCWNVFDFNYFYILNFLLLKWTQKIQKINVLVPHRCCMVVSTTNIQNITNCLPLVIQSVCLQTIRP